MVYLLDTNAWITYLKHAGSAIHARLKTLRPSDVLTCSVVRAELLHGAQKYGNRKRRVEIVLRTLAPYRSLAFDDDAATQYADLRHTLEVAGETIGRDVDLNMPGSLSKYFRDDVLASAQVLYDAA